MTGRFDRDGARLSFDGEDLGVRTVSVGRPGDLGVFFADPALGACLPGMADPTGACVRRLEQADGAVTAWWAARDGGFQQGWIVDASPIGDGPLVVTVAADDATVEARGEDLWIAREGGGAVRVSGLSAWDALGTPLAARFETTEGGFAVVVEDADALYPVEIDPYWTTANWSVAGVAGNNPFAEVVAGAGDLNGDGYDDVAIGCPSVESQTGAVYVYHGSVAGFADTADTVLTGPDSGSLFGESVDGAGDIDGDGYDDLVVGEPEYSTETGRVYVYHGSASGLSTTYATQLTGPSAGSDFGHSVAGAGDVNADGRADVIVGAYGSGSSSSHGKAYVFHGSSTGLSSSAAVTLYGSYLFFGRSVSDAGDVNGDGYDDVIVGEPAYNSYYGRAYIYLGSSLGITTAGSTTITGTYGSEFGDAVAGAGDVDGDGYDEVIVGAPGYSSSATARAHVYPGSASGTTTSAVSTFSAASSNTELGAAVAGVGDVNGDGYADVIVGDPADDTNTGRVDLYTGSIAGLSSTVAETWSGDGTSNYFGLSVAGAGDVDADGNDDLLIGAYAENAGVAHVYTGGASTLTESTIDGDVDFYLGFSLSTAGDVNGDGYDDVVVGAYGHRSAAGAAWVYEGSASGLSETAALELEGPAVSSYFGYSVAGGGDTNRDGYDDIVVGAWYASTYGKVYVYPGSSSGVSATPSTTVSGTSSNTYVGRYVLDGGDLNGDGYADLVVGSGSKLWTYHGAATGISSTASATLTVTHDRIAIAGDVNGDGCDDLLVGSSSYSSSTGVAYVYQGASTGLATTVATTLSGYAASSYFGRGLDGAGDIDGDGYDDVVVGAYGYNGSRGRAYFYHGSVSGLASSVVSLISGVSADDQLGYGVAGLGDTNGDGYDDVAISAPGWNTAGGVFVHLGSASGITSTPESTLEVTATEVRAAGDVDGDGLTDLLLGHSAADSSGGAAWVYTAYADADADGYAAGSDCDDTDASVTVATPMYADADADGYGDPGSSVEACTPPAGYVTDATDCDDAAAAINQGASEICDATNTDEDCDGAADDADGAPTGTTTVYADGDGDGEGATPATFCDVPAAGYSSVGGDCDDSDAAINAAAAEVCDGADADEDCDGLADDLDGSASGHTPFHADGDSDGFGGASVGSYCDAPAGAVSDATDCDDGDPAISPAATEVCDASDVDDDCDGLAADFDGGATGTTSWYADGDGDGSGAGAALSACDAPVGHVASGTDCDDAAADTHPGAAEVCDAADADEDCDDAADDADATATGQSVAYGDGDGDRYGTGSGAAFCDAPAGWIPLGGDCDDGDAAASPAGAEVAGDGVDGDCDGTEACYADADADGYRGTELLASSDLDCDDAGEAGTGATPDCDDEDASVHGGQEEVPGDGLDSDCDGIELCFADGDGDGYRADATSTVASDDLACDGAGEAPGDAPVGDCDDADGAFHPGADEGNCADFNDYNCDGSSGATDADGDGYAACEECDDARTSAHPGAEEACNARDDDCDGAVDDNATDATTWYPDTDTDGYTSPAGAVTACDVPDGYAAATEDDCDDDDASAHPGGNELPGDGVDQDCDGADATDDISGGGKESACGCASSGNSRLAAIGTLLAIGGVRRRSRIVGGLRESQADSGRFAENAGRRSMSGPSADV